MKLSSKIKSDLKQTGLNCQLITHILNQIQRDAKSFWYSLYVLYYIIPSLWAIDVGKVSGI